MKLLISPRDVEEALQAFDGGADIIDIKNPDEGSLGANFPWIIREIKNTLPTDSLLSATIGDMDDRPGFASLAAFGLSEIGVTYLKVGMFVRKSSHATRLVRSIVKATENRPTKVIVAGYADHKKIGTIDPMELISIASLNGTHGVMIDTYEKRGKTLFDHKTSEELTEFIIKAKKTGLLNALAGSIQSEHIPILKQIDPNIIGIRTAVCTNNHRELGKIKKQKVQELKKLIQQ